MNARVLFIIHDVYQEHNVFPLGPAYLAAVLKQAGVQVDVCCQDVFHYSQDYVAELVRDGAYDIIGMGFLAARYKETVEPLCRAINETKGDAWLVLGGHGASSMPEYVLDQTRADVVVIGEAEETILDLVACKINGSPLTEVPGIGYRDVNGIKINPRRKAIADLDSIPFPQWDLFPMEQYTTCSMYPGQEKSEKSLAISTTRGCTNRCSFCYRMEKGIRKRSIDSVIAEIKTLFTDYGVSYFLIVDELMFFNKQRVFEFEEALERSGLNIKYSCAVRANMIDRETAESLKRSGCRLANIGFESMEQTVLDRMNKRTTVEENFRAADICKKTGLVMGLNVIWGNPGDSEESLWKLVDFLKTYNTYGQLRTIRPVTPYPGCQLFDDAVAMGLLSGPGDFFDKFHNSDLITVNYTELSTEDCHKLLFAANTELILDHYLKVKGDMREAKTLIDAFFELYFEQQYKFRGARQYDRKD